MAYTTIDDPTIYFNTKLYAGNGSTNAQTGVGFQPDWVWIKNRSASDHHALYDSVRGANEFLSSSRTNIAEITQSDGLMSFNSDGFTVGADGGVNTNSNNFVAWNWKAGGSASSNSNGSITSSVSANTTAGFSIGTYNGSGSDNTVGHGLGVAPDMIFVRCRSTAHDWVVYHSALGNAKILTLNATTAAQSATGWQSTSPTSAVFSIDNAANSLNQSGQSFVFYAMASKKGYSKFGSYTGNGNADGTFVYTGFSPAFVLLKNADEVEQWWIFDNKRNAYDGNFKYYALNPNASSAEGTTSGDNNHIDFYSNGFKLRTTAQQLNGTSDNFIYMAFAEAPFVTSTGIPTTAR